MIKFLLWVLVAVAAHRSNQELRVTFVTGLWDVSRGDMIIFKRSFDYYLSYLRDVLQISDKIIMFGNAEVRQFVEDHRKHSDNILFIEKDLKDIQQYWYTPKIGAVIDKAKEDWLKWQQYSILPQYGLRMYNPVVMSKLKFVAEASLVDPFHSDYYIWIDGGVTHSFDKSILQEGTFVKFARNFQLDWLIQTGKGLPYHPFEVGFKNEGREYANISSKERFYVWGNWLGGKASAATTAYNIYQNFLRLTLENGDMNTDEALLFLMLERYSYLYHRVVDPDTFGTHKMLLVNSSIVEERYALREIKASEVVRYSSLRQPSNQPCLSTPQLSIRYGIEDYKYYYMLLNQSQHSLRIRLGLIVAFLALLLASKQCLQTGKYHFQKLRSYDIQ